MEWLAGSVRGKSGIPLRNHKAEYPEKEKKKNTQGRKDNLTEQQSSSVNNNYVSYNYEPSRVSCGRKCHSIQK